MKDLFGNEVQIKDLTKERKSVHAHKLLIVLYGAADGKKCGACKHFYFNVASKKYPKCALSGCDGHTQNQDWSSRWQACGRYESERRTDV